MINKTLLFTYLYLLVYILLSSGVILYNKVPISLSIWVLGAHLCVSSLLWISAVQWVLSPKYFNFPFPITLTMIHMGFSGAVAFFLVRVFKVWLSCAGLRLQNLCWFWVCFVWCWYRSLRNYALVFVLAAVLLWHYVDSGCAFLFHLMLYTDSY